MSRLEKDIELQMFQRGDSAAEVSHIQIGKVCRYPPSPANGKLPTTR